MSKEESEVPSLEEGYSEEGVPDASYYEDDQFYDDDSWSDDDEYFPDEEDAYGDFEDEETAEGGGSVGSSKAADELDPAAPAGTVHPGAAAGGAAKKKAAQPVADRAKTMQVEHKSRIRMYFDRVALASFHDRSFAELQSAGLVFLLCFAVTPYIAYCEFEYLGPEAFKWLFRVRAGAEGIQGSVDNWAVSALLAVLFTALMWWCSYGVVSSSALLDMSRRRIKLVSTGRLIWLWFKPFIPLIAISAGVVIFDLYWIFSIPAQFGVSEFLLPKEGAQEELRTMIHGLTEQIMCDNQCCGLYGLKDYADYGIPQIPHACTMYKQGCLGVMGRATVAIQYIVQILYVKIGAIVLVTFVIVENVIGEPTSPSYSAAAAAGSKGKDDEDDEVVDDDEP